MKMERICRGGYHTVLSADIPEGEAMQEHYSTSEALIIVLEGSAMLIFKDKQVHLSKGSVYLIPGLKVHSLEALEDLKIYLVLGTAGNIKMIEKRPDQLEQLVAFA